MALPPHTKPNLPADPDPEKTERLGKISAGIAVATAAVWTVWDIIPAMWQGRNDTLSEKIRNFARYAWAFVVFWGALTAHFFINTGQPENSKERFLAFMALIVGFAAVNCVTYFKYAWEGPVWFRVSCLFSGMVIGLGLWAQDA